MSGKRHVLMVSHHHVLWDGWSLPVILRELFALYGQGGDVSVLPRVAPFRDYLQWLTVQDEEAAESAWRNSLAGLEEPTRVAPAGLSLEPGPQEKLSIELTEETTSALNTAARQGAVTLNTLIQAAWAILLARMTGRHDIVFGATVSGRPAELPGVERHGRTLHQHPPGPRHPQPRRTTAHNSSPASRTNNPPSPPTSTSASPASNDWPDSENSSTPQPSSRTTRSARTSWTPRK